MIVRLEFIVNAFASSVTARTRVVIAKALSADHEVVVRETEQRNHATELAADAAARGIDAVIVLGGDGTMNEAANGLVGTDCALGVLPGGSTNVFARAVGFTNDPIEAAGELLGGLATQSFKTVGLGKANDRHFLFHCGLRFDAAIVEWVEERGEIKRFAGHPMFAWSALRTWINMGRGAKPLHVKAEHDDVCDEMEAAWVIVMNTNPYTFVGNRPFNVAPRCTLDSPLTLLAFENLSAFTLGNASLQALRNARNGAEGSPHLTHLSDVTSALVDSTKTFGWQMDGDYLGTTTAVNFSYVPDAIRLILPER